MPTTKTKKARLDTEGTAKPLTRLVGHAREGQCVGGTTVRADAIEDTATGERTPLATVPASRCGACDGVFTVHADGVARHIFAAGPFAGTVDYERQSKHAPVAVPRALATFPLGQQTFTLLVPKDTTDDEMSRMCDALDALDVWQKLEGALRSLIAEYPDQFAGIVVRSEST